MPSFESPALFIDFSRLPPPKVVEEVEYEALLKTYQDRVIDPDTGLPSLARAVALEQSPTNIILQTQSQGEAILRTRVNAAARASMLAFAVGPDLDNLAAFFAQNRMFDISRLPIVDNPRPLTTNPEDWESDERFRRRIQLAPEAFASAGSEGGYIFHALSADPSIRDASAIRLDDRGLVRITLLGSEANPTPTKAQIDAVAARLNDRRIKPLTDTVWVTPAEIFEVSLRGIITLYPGPDQALVLGDIRAALNAIRVRTSKLGRDLTRSQIIHALTREGVQNAELPEPAKDTICNATQCVVIKDAALNVQPLRME